MCPLSHTILRYGYTNVETNHIVIPTGTIFKNYRATINNLYLRCSAPTDTMIMYDSTNVEADR